MQKFFSKDFSLIKKNARELRKNCMESEELLWEQIRNRKLGYKFLRQHPIVYKGDLSGLNYFIADFYCHSTGTVIELDGLIHEQTKEYDSFRDEELEFKGLNILRIKNDELKDMPSVLKKIIEFLNSHNHHLTNTKNNT